MAKMPAEPKRTFCFLSGFGIRNEPNPLFVSSVILFSLPTAKLNRIKYFKIIFQIISFLHIMQSCRQALNSVVYLFISPDD